MNAQQYKMTGGILTSPDLNVVVCEGGPRGMRKFKRLMLHRYGYGGRGTKRKVRARRRKWFLCVASGGEGFTRRCLMPYGHPPCQDAGGMSLMSSCLSWANVLAALPSPLLPFLSGSNGAKTRARASWLSGRPQRPRRTATRSPSRTSVCNVASCGQPSNDRALVANVLNQC
jgi:hypothetical protein